MNFKADTTGFVTTIYVFLSCSFKNQRSNNIFADWVYYFADFWLVDSADQPIRGLQKNLCQKDDSEIAVQFFFNFKMTNVTPKVLTCKPIQAMIGNIHVILEDYSSIFGNVIQFFTKRTHIHMYLFICCWNNGKKFLENTFLNWNLTFSKF